jgi:methionine-rich copper-binding protein CopC
MKPVLALLLFMLTAALAFTASPAYAQIELTEADPPDGAQLAGPPDLVHLCFSEPVIIVDNTAFRFRYLTPDDRSLGLRIEFQTDGECVDVFPGLQDMPPPGEYAFEWQVVAAEGGEEGSGVLRYQVSGTGAATPSTSPTPPTPSPRSTATPEQSPVASRESPTPSSETTVAPSASPETAMTPDGGAGSEDADDDGGPDILLLALVTIGSVGGAAVLFTLGYLLRKRIGYEPHRPPERDEGSDGGEH